MHKGFIWKHTVVYKIHELYLLCTIILKVLTDLYHQKFVDLITIFAIICSESQMAVMILQPNN